jgi:hypothetical protein
LGEESHLHPLRNHQLVQVKKKKIAINIVRKKKGPERLIVHKKLISG